MRWRSELTGLAVLVLVPSLLPAQEGGEGDRRKPKDGGDDLPRVVKVDDVTFPEQTAQLVGPQGAWLPVYVELSSLSGKPEQVVIEGTVFASRSAVQFRTVKKVEVAPGAPQRAWIYLRVGPQDNSGQSLSLSVEVRSAAGAVLWRRQPWPINVSERNDSGSLSLLVMGESLGDLVPWPGELTLNRNRDEQLNVAPDALTPSQAPDSWLGYQPHDLLIVRDVGAKALEPAQVEALRAWVFLGGRIVFAPQGRSSEVFRSPAAEAFFGKALGDPAAADGFIPKKLFQSDAGTRGAGMRDVDGGSRLGLTSKEQYTLLDPLGAEAAYEISAVPEGSLTDDPTFAKRIYAEVPYGRGAAGIVCFDDQAHRRPTSQAFLQAFWAPIVGRAAASGRGSFVRQSSVFESSALANALKDPQREVGVRVMVGLIGGFVLLVGPVLYFVLKRLNRLPAVLWVEPLLVVVYVGVIFATAYLTKGVLTKVRVMTIFSQHIGEPLAIRESYLSLFAGAEGTYAITASKGSAYLRPIYKNAKEARPARLLRTPAGELKLEDNALAHWQEGGYSSAGIEDFVGPGIEVHRREDGAGEAGTVRVTNRLPYDVKEGVVYASRIGYPLPAIARGASVDVVLAEALSENRHEKRVGELLGATGGRSSGYALIALLDRSEVDFTIDQPTSLKERFDYFVLHQ